MRVEAFDIVFDDSAVNPQAVYRSGQTVACRVHLKLLEPVKCRAVYVHLFGNSYVHWTESRSSGSGKRRRTRTVHYRSEEIYMDQKVAIYTPETTGPNAEHHPAGEYFYPVTFQIPDTAPSSYEGGVGKIRYHVKASIDRPWRFDKYCQIMYTVIRELDLNRELTSLTGPHTTSDDFDVNCCYCFNCCFGRVRVRVCLARRAFVPGEHVHVTGELMNTSSTDLEAVNLEIYQRNKFHAGGKTRTNTRVASSVQLQGVAKGDTLTLDHQLPVNPVPSSRIEGCGNIEVQYFMRLNVDGGCCLSMRKECCELLIGTVPLWSAYGSDTTTSVPSAPQYSMLAAPPSYEESMFGPAVMDESGAVGVGNARQHGTRQTHWAPSYPVFSALTPVNT